MNKSKIKYRKQSSKYGSHNIKIFYLFIIVYYVIFYHYYAFLCLIFLLVLLVLRAKSNKIFTLAQIPLHKRLPNTNYLVDCFNIHIQDLCLYFLSHFHADHYIGLNKKFASTLFCSVTTANLVIKNLRVDEKQIVKLQMYRWYEIDNNKYVYLIDANHCPGAVCFIFRVNSLFYLHTGDFRASKQFYDQFKYLDNVDIYKTDNTFLEKVCKNKFYNLNEKIVTYKIMQNMSCKNKNETISDIIETKNKKTSNLQNSTKYNILHTNFEKSASYDDICMKNYNRKSNNIVVNYNYDIYCDAKKWQINKTCTQLAIITQNDVIKTAKNYTMLNLKFENLFLDNTYEHYKFFDTQKKVINRILKIIDNKNKGCLIPVKYKYLFATYSIGKEKIFLSVAEYLNCFVQIEKRKMDFYMCFDDYTTEKIDKEVKNIVKNYKENNGTKNDVRYYLIPLEKKCVIEKHNKNKKRSVICKNKSNVFSRLTENEDKNSIELISMMHLNKNKIQKICQKYDSDRICIFVGSGWNEKTIYYDFEKENGRTVKKGIEVYYLPYSEHSSNLEINEFVRKVNCKTILNTVKNTWNIN